MSHEPHVRETPFGAAPTRPSASGPGDRIASGRDVAIYFREDCRTLRDSLQLEMVVAQYCMRMRDVRTTDGVPVGDAVALRVVAELEHEADELSHAILRGIAHIAVGLMAQRSAEAIARLCERAVDLPTQFADVGQAKAIGAWRTQDVEFDGEYALFADFEYPRGADHAIALYAEPKRGGVVKHIGLLRAMRDLDPYEPFHPSAMEELDIPEAGAEIAKLLERTYGALGEETDDFRVLVAAARAKSILIEPKSG